MSEVGGRGFGAQNIGSRITPKLLHRSTKMQFAIKAHGWQSQCTVLVGDNLVVMP